MKNRTFRTIVILISLLFINIEAAHAGLVQKFKLYIGHEFPGLQFIYIVGAALTIVFLLYIIFAPAFKEGVKIAGNSYYMHNTYQNKRNNIKKISDILREPQSGN